jgi:hypothetical protein
MKTQILRFTTLVLFCCLLLDNPAYADNIGLVMQGVARTLFSVAELPKSIIVGGASSFPFGIITGTLEGTMRATAGTLIGATDIARGAAPYAKYMVFFM